MACRQKWAVIAMAVWTQVLVGVDGSEGSQRALQWAAEEARQHEAELHVLSTWSSPAPAVGLGYIAMFTESSNLQELTRQLQDDAVRAALGDQPGLVIKQDVVEGHPAQRLTEASAEADLVVVGSRGHGGFVGMLLGSVSQHVAAHAQCPVIIIR